MKLQINLTREQLRTENSTLIASNLNYNCKLKSIHSVINCENHLIMKSLNIFILIYFLCTSTGFAQTGRPLPRTINIPSKNHISPSLSADGSLLIYNSNYSFSNKMVLKYSEVENGAWTESAEIEISDPEKDFVGGHWLTYDSKQLYIASKRIPSFGGYDINVSDKSGNYFSPPQNLGKPINTNKHEAHASLSPDGKYMYFMRCETMDNYEYDNCELYVAERKTGVYWNEPQKLPYPINTGNESAPRIMPDGETLIFASKRAGGKGGWDLYQSIRQPNGWSDPVALDYLNTPQDEQYASVPAHSNYIYYSTLHDGNFRLMMSPIPQHMKPKKLVMINGSLKDAVSGRPLQGAAQVYNANTREQEQFIKTDNKGNFFVLIKGDGIYDFSIITMENKHEYYANLYDLRGLAESQIETLNLNLKAARAGGVVNCSAIQFESYSANIIPESEIGLRRLIKFMKQNKVKVEIGVHTDEVIQDSVLTNAGLTEVEADTVFLRVPLVSSTGDSLATDYTLQYQYQEKGYQFDPIKNQFYKVTHVYHNDRTQQQAEAVKQKLISMGVPAYLIQAKGYGDSKKLVPNTSAENRRKNKRVEARIL